MVGDIGLKQIEQGLVKFGLVGDGKSASGLNKLCCFWKFLVVRSKDERQAKGGGFDGIMESFSARWPMVSRIIICVFDGMLLGYSLNLMAFVLILLRH